MAPCFMQANHEALRAGVKVEDAFLLMREVSRHFQT